MKNATVFSGFQTQWLAMLAGMICLFTAAGVAAKASEQPPAAASKEISAKAASGVPAIEPGRPCAEDIAKLCKDVTPGKGRMAKCVKDHEKDLSPACKKNIAKMNEKIRKMQQTCEEDAKKLCQDTKPGRGNIVQCLKQHEGELSPDCKGQLTHLRDRKAADGKQGSGLQPAP